MYQLQPICRAIALVEEHLKEPMTVADMAEAACYSLYHFCRIFNSVTQHTPYNYLIRRRLSESARDLLHCSQKIIETAYDYHFNSPETYARAFRRMFGMLPREWRKCGTLTVPTLLPRLTVDYLRHINTHLTRQPVCIQQPLTLAGVMTLINQTRTGRTQLWNLFRQEQQHVPMSGPFWGMTYYCGQDRSQGFYLATGETDQSDLAGTPFMLKQLPALQYARFLHEGPAATLPLTFQYIYHTWMPQAGKTAAAPLELESCASLSAFADDLTVTRAIYVPVS